MFQTEVLENKHFMLSSVSGKLYCLWDNVEKCCRAGQATDFNKMHARFMLDTERYTQIHTHKHTHTHTHTEYVILIAFPLQQWLH